MSEFGRSKEEFVKTFLELPNGISSKDTIRRVFTLIDSTVFEQCFVEWVSSIADLSKGQVLAIDRKTLRGTRANGRKSPIHMVSAWACQNNSVLGQVGTAAKSNVITAIPELLELLNIEQTTITIDAMGTQKEIAQKIVAKKADYILAVKENQKQLLQNIKDEFRFSKQVASDTKQDIAHGRIETRICSVISEFQFLHDNKDGASLKSVVKIESTREFKNSNNPLEKAQDITSQV